VAAPRLVEALILASFDAKYGTLQRRSHTVRTTITLDDDLVSAAQEYTGIQEKSALVRAALKALVEREAARRLARMGGSAPDLKLAPRRRFRTT
jgi:Arc/MetJ family transcription regulator